MKACTLLFIIYLSIVYVSMFTKISELIKYIRFRFLCYTFFSNFTVNITIVLISSNKSSDSNIISTMLQYSVTFVNVTLL